MAPWKKHCLNFALHHIQKICIQQLDARTWLWLAEILSCHFLIQQQHVRSKHCESTFLQDSVASSAPAPSVDLEWQTRSRKYKPLKQTFLAFRFPNRLFCKHWATCFWASLSKRKNKIPQGNCDFILTKCFINVNRSSGSTNCAAENSKPRVMHRDQRGDQPIKNWENIDFSKDLARVLALSSQRHTMWS